MKRLFTLMFFAVLLAMPAAAHATKICVVFAAPANSNGVADVASAENSLRNLEICQVLQAPAMKAKLTDAKLDPAAVKDLAGATAIDDALHAEYVFWLEGWNEAKDVFAAMLVDRKSGAKRRATANLREKDDVLREQLVKGAVVALAEGKDLCPPTANWKDPKVRKSANWGEWTGLKKMPDRSASSVLVKLDERGKVAKAWLLETSLTPYGERAMVEVPRYDFAPAKRDDAPALSYGIVETYMKRTGQEDIDFPGTNRVWGQIFLEEIK
jgi:hypothetical protein